MPAKDVFHIGLEKEGWKTTSDPLYLGFGGVEIYIDLAAEKLIAAEREGKKLQSKLKALLAVQLFPNFTKHWGNLLTIELS